jgi:hypothetical protein
MRKPTIVSLLSLAALACPATPGPVEPVPPTPEQPIPAVPVNTVTAALSGHEGAYAVAGEWFQDPAQPPMAFTATTQQWFGDDGMFYQVYDQPAAEASGPGMQGWGRLWADEAGAAHMWWMDSMAPGTSLEMTGTVAEDGTITIEGVGPGPDEAPTTYRSIYRLPAEGPDVFEMGVVRPDGTFVLMMKYTATRTGDAVKTWAPPAPAAATEPPVEQTPVEPAVAP